MLWSVRYVVGWKWKALAPTLTYIDALPFPLSPRFHLSVPLSSLPFCECVVYAFIEPKMCVVCVAAIVIGVAAAMHSLSLSLSRKNAGWRASQQTSLCCVCALQSWVKLSIESLGDKSLGG